MIIMGLDVATACGIAILEGNGSKAVALHHAETLTAKGGHFERGVVLADYIADLATTHRPDAIAMEDVFASGNMARAIVVLARLQGAVGAELVRRGFGDKIILYPPAVIKKTLTGNGSAPKALVAESVYSRVLPELSLPSIVKSTGKRGDAGKITDDTTDAIAIAYTAYLISTGLLVLPSKARKARKPAKRKGKAPDFRPVMFDDF